MESFSRMLNAQMILLVYLRCGNVLYEDGAH